MIFKSSRLEAEFNNLPVQNKRLYRVLKLADEYSQLEFGKDIVVTEIYRTPAENAALYKQSAEPIWRPHVSWQGADLRSSIYTDQQIQKLISFLGHVTSFGGQRKTAVYHAIAGNVFHFHIQTERQ